MKKFEGKNIVIVGGTSGIGEKAAISLAESGANIVLCGRNIENGILIAEEIKKNRSKGKVYKM